MKFAGPRPLKRLGDSATYACPCCGDRYETLVVGHYDWDHPVTISDGFEFPLIVEQATAADGTRLDVCQRCHLPCCPRCEHIAGEGMIVCSRCTTFFGCTHANDRP